MKTTRRSIFGVLSAILTGGTAKAFMHVPEVPPKPDGASCYGHRLGFPGKGYPRYFIEEFGRCREVNRYRYIRTARTWGFKFIDELVDRPVDHVLYQSEFPY